MKVELDVGNNITSLIERLAAQIGTTADKVFPWYVQQAQLEGITTLVTIAVLLMVLAPAFAYSLRNADTQTGEKYIFLAAGTGIALGFTCLISTFEAPQSVRQILNPNYYAMKMMTRDIARMTGK